MSSINDYLSDDNYNTVTPASVNPDAGVTRLKRRGGTRSDTIPQQRYPSDW
ncbi:MAG: hypothetical protein ACI80I_002464 [Akkermansiaceae bacterium]